MNKVNELDARNILSTYDLYEIWDGPEGEVEIQILFKVINFSIENIIDNKNYAGEVTYEIDTEFGGGPALISTAFIIVDNKLEIEEDLIDTNELDWDEIDEEIAKEFDESKKIIN